MDNEIAEALAEQQKFTVSNLEQISLCLLDTIESIETSEFRSADDQLGRLEEAIAFSRIACQGMALIRDVQEI